MEPRDPVALPSRCATGSLRFGRDDDSVNLLISRGRNVLIAVATLLLGAAALHRFLPFPEVEHVTPKLRFFAAHQDEFDTLFIGTSRIEHHIAPEIFDRVAAEKGLPTRSFNFGIDGMHPAESFYVVEQILKSRPRKLKWVFFELEDVLTDWSTDARGTRRLAYWHDWKRTKQTLRRIVNPRGDARWYAEMARAVLSRREIALHISLFAKQFVNLGRAGDFLENSSTEMNAQLGPRGDGYRPPGTAMQAERAARYEQKLERETSNARPRFVDPHAEKSYREYAAQFHKLGAASLFVVTPVVTQSPLRLRADPPPPGPVLAFNDRRAYPQLYGAEVRVDESHLTKAGADEFTRLIAEEFVRRVAHP